MARKAVLGAVADEIEIRGQVSRLFSSSDRFSAGILHPEDDDITSVRFSAPMKVALNEDLHVRGHWADGRFGKQFKVRCRLYDEGGAISPQGLVGFLAAHPEVRQIGPSRVRILVERFGDRFEEALRDETDAMARSVGVPLGAIQTLAELWLRERETNATRTMLAGFGLTQPQIERMLDVLTVGGECPDVKTIASNPYLLLGKVPGLGFKRVDAMAHRLGVQGDHPARLRAGVVHAVEESLESGGHTWISEAECLVRTQDLLTVDRPDALAEQVGTLVHAGQLIRRNVAGRCLLALPEIYESEAALAEAFAEVRPNPHFGNTDLARLESEHARGLHADGQLPAVRLALTHSQSAITGGAGSGKTYVACALARIYLHSGRKVILAAPTGKAARRLTEASGLPATTIHKLLNFDGECFRFDGCLDADLLIIDEASMVDARLAWHLHRAVDLRRTSILWVGDPNQLLPVGAGCPFRDVVDHDLIPVARLSQIVRQAGILRENCNSILRGEVPARAECVGMVQPWWPIDQFDQEDELQQVVDQLYNVVLPDELRFNLLRDVQLLTPRHEGPLGTTELNRRIQRIVQRKIYGVTIPESDLGGLLQFFVGDRVIQGRNNYETGVMNGEIGQVETLEGKDLIVRFDTGPVRYDPERRITDGLALAYALTIHRSQGSEFPCSIVVVHRSHRFMLNRNLLYVGVSRAQKTAILLGDRDTLEQTARKEDTTRRRTLLPLLWSARGQGGPDHDAAE